MRKQRVGLIDWAMLALAVVSVGLIAYETWWPGVTAEQTRLILQIDYVIITIFAIEFLFRWNKAGWRRQFLGRNWYDILGMIPVAHPAVRGFRLFRIVRVVVILSRFGRAADRAFGEEFTYRLVRRFKGILVEGISDAVTLRVMDQTEQILLKGDFSGNLADGLEKRWPEIQSIVIEKVHNDPQVGRVRHLPFFDDLVGISSRVTQRIIVDLLRDPRMDEILKDMIRDNMEQIKEAVRVNEALRGSNKEHPRAA